MLRIMVFLFLFILSSQVLAQSGAHGKQFDYIIQRYGEPSFTAHGANGNTIYGYVRPSLSQFRAPPVSNPTVIVAPGGRAIGATIPSPPSSNPMNMECTTIYEVNKQGTIVGIRMKGC